MGRKEEERGVGWRAGLVGGKADDGVKSFLCMVMAWLTSLVL